MDRQQKTVLNRYLTDLSLSTINQHHETLSKQAESESASYTQYLFNVIEQEWESRRQKRIQRRLKESRLPLEKTFDTFDLKRLPGKINQQIRTLAKGDFVQQCENILLFGNPGSGKTHLICALGHALIEEDKRVYCTTCAMLLQELLLAKKELRLPRLLKRFSRFDAIIIDDIGYVHQDKEEMEALFTMLAERYEKGSVMITSNLPFSKWERIFKDPMMTAAAIDRVVHHSVILELNIDSFRIQSAKKSRKN